MKSFKSFPKAILAALLISTGVLTWSCADKIDDQGASEVTFTLPEQPIIKNNYASQNNTITVVASHNVSWKAVKTDADAEWLTITSASGKGNGNIIFSLAGKNTPGKRQTSVTITGTAEGKELSGVVTVEQLGSDPTIVMEPVGTVSVPWNANDAYSVKIVSNVNWSTEVTIVSGDADWITKTSPTENILGDGMIELNISKNSSDQSRQAILTVTYVDDPAIKAELTINQQKQGERHKIEFQGMTTLLGNDGNTTLEYAKVSDGATTTLSDVEVEVGTDLTTVYYMEEIPDGAYELKKVGSVNVNALFTMSGGAITYVERWNPAFDCFGGETLERPISISGKSNLEALASSVNAGEAYTGIYFIQTANIELGSNWTAIGTTENKFSGIYDGKGFEITKFKLAATTPGQGLFGYVGGVAASEDGMTPATVAALKNITIKGSGSTPSDDSSDNGFDVTGTAGYIGVIAANVTGNTVVSNCKNYAHARLTISTGANGPGNSGGVIGEIGGPNVSVEKCVNYAKIVVYSASNTLVNNVGGVIGNTSGGSTEVPTVISECYNYGDLTFIGNTGGVVGNIGNENITLQRSANYGAIVATGGNGRSGGVAGGGNGVIDQCFNLGNVVCSPANGNNTGGIVGWVGGSGKLSNSYNKGTVTYTAANSGTLLGNKSTATYGIINCYNSGKAQKDAAGTALGTTGGAINGGAKAGGANVSGCYYLANNGNDLGQNAITPDDASRVKALSQAEMQTATAFAGWDTAIWNFENGKYPTLKNNPEKPL